MKIKKIGKFIAIITIVLFVGILLFHNKCPTKPLRDIDKNVYLIPQTVYKPPLIKIPFIKDKAPVKRENLPIPRKDVAKTIEIIQPEGKKVTIVIDKKGKVYRSKDTPKDVEIKVSTWMPRLFGLQSKWGIGIIMDIPPDLSFALSWDTIRIWRLHFGVDLGVQLKEYGLANTWLGTSVKFKILKNNNLFALVGYNWMDKTPYMGVMMRF